MRQGDLGDVKYLVSNQVFAKLCCKNETGIECVLSIEKSEKADRKMSKYGTKAK